MDKDNKNNQKQINNDDGIIVLKNVTKKFGGNVVLKDISLDIQKGKTTVIIGPSGCGKTVLIKHMIVLIRPTKGEVYFKGRRIDNLDEDQLNRIRMHYGFLFQGGALFDSLTVEENIIFPLRQFHNRHLDLTAARQTVKAKLALVGLDGFQGYFPSQLSGGQRKRVSLARAIALNPEVILYDEPTTGLDPIRADVINELILKLQKELGLTSVAVTHDMTSAYKIGDRIIMLHNGMIHADGDSDHIRNHPDPVVQKFITGRLSKEDLSSLNTGVLSHI